MNKLSYKFAEQIAQTPGLLEFYVNFCDLSGRVPINDSGWRHLKKWLKEAEGKKNLSPNLGGQRLLFFSILPTHVDYSLALAVLLLAKGANIDFAWLSHPTYGSQIPPTLSYLFWRRTANRMHGKHLHPRLRLFDLEKVPPVPITPEMREIASRRALMDASYVLLKERVQIDHNPHDKAEYEFRLDRNLDALRRLAHLCREYKYGRLILINGAILEFGAAYDMIEKMGIPISTFEVQNNGTIIVSHGASVMGMDASDLWIRDEPHLLSEERRKRVQQLIEHRQKPAPKGITLDALQLTAIVPAEAIRNQLGLQSNKPIVLVCPNCPFDAAYYVEGKKHFPTMVEWLIKTMEYLVKRNDCQVIVRCHPAETYYRAVETTELLLKEFFQKLPPHIQIVNPEDLISTYSIMNVADIGLVYWSTTGLEMAMRGIPVVCGVPSVHYNNKGFTMDPQTLDEYFQIIDRALKSPKAARLTPRQIELAWCYADIFFNDWPKPFPWGAGRRFWHDLKKWPIARILSPEGMSQYGRTLDLLLGT